MSLGMRMPSDSPGPPVAGPGPPVAGPGPPVAGRGPPVAGPLFVRLLGIADVLSKRENQRMIGNFKNQDPKSL